uniref:Pentapeptide repeat-containing protein n=1 Tax=Candidatus Kentrum eta TaxID=2126337 RepID=A0A450UGD8_9GAMM|nr:MAG: Pentapeptide repeat-containing protein [Candidatus Kentron sp. H]VFJ92677.1 MAG: Pentapeptide repeat-containing protein [Candidatus Kentron sp. H]VFJ99474.1 MAG: Pentapeptide repeat-containing protein [Candidatus Kentron sp. H]
MRTRTHPLSVLARIADRFMETIALLATELATCRVGGLYPALHTDPELPQQVADTLARQSPDTVSFALHMDAGKAVFPVFFKYTYQHLGAGTNIFHVLGIEGLDEKLADDFIRALQGGREMFRKAPYALVFWVTPAFEKRLFALAPDFHHWVFHTFDFTDLDPTSVIPAGKPGTSVQGWQQITQCQGWQEQGNAGTQPPETAINRQQGRQDTTDRLPIENIRQYLKKALDQFHHWAAVKARGEDFLMEPMGRANLHGNYVTSTGRERATDKVQTLDSAFAEFLEDDNRGFMALLGDFGTGKTSFSPHYFVLLAERFLHDPTQRIPLFISLKDYPGQLDIARFMERAFFQRFSIPLSFAVFRDLALAGRFVLFVDGFDEMASMADEAATLANFQELTKLTFEGHQFMLLPSNAPRQGNKPRRNKLFLTCRTHYFLTETQQANLLTADTTVLYRNHATRSHYAIPTLLLQAFTEAQVLEYVENARPDPQQAREILAIIKDTYNLKELSSRPLLLEMIVTSLEHLKGKQSIDAYQLYKTYTNIWIERDDWRAHMTPAGKRALMWELAGNMHQQGGDFSLHYSKLNKPKASYLKPGFFSDQEEDYFRYEITTCSFLNRDGKGNYKFIHKSFSEFFLAERIFYTGASRSKTITFGEYSKEVAFFILHLVISNKKQLAGWRFEKMDFSILAASSRDLSQADLRNAKLENANLEKTNLRGAVLRGADLRRANLRKAVLREADLRKTNLMRANLGGADLREADLSGADFDNTDLTSADLTSVSLKRAKGKPIR